MARRTTAETIQPSAFLLATKELYTPEMVSPSESTEKSGVGTVPPSSLTGKNLHTSDSSTPAPLRAR